MNRRLAPFALVITGSLLAYACSSSDDGGGGTPTGDGGTSGSSGTGTSGSSGDGGGSSGDGGGSSGDGGGSSSGNPIDGVTTAALSPNFDNSTPVQTDGPLWGTDKNFYFSAVGTASNGVQFQPTNADKNSNTTIFYPNADGALTGNAYDTKTSRIISALAATGGTGTIVATPIPAAGGAFVNTPLTLNFGIDGGAAAFDSPWDLVARKDGLIFVTDGAQNDTAATGSNHIWRLRPTATTNTYDALDFSIDGRPTGIALSGDEKTLFVSFRNPQNAIPHVDKFTVATTDGALSAQTKISDIGTMDQAATNLSGLALDSAGNLYVAWASGVEVLKPDGTKWGHIALPANTHATNVGFGGADLKTLYITSDNGLLQVTVKVAGVVQ